MAELGVPTCIQFLQYICILYTVCYTGYRGQDWWSGIAPCTYGRSLTIILALDSQQGTLPKGSIIANLVFGNQAVMSVWGQEGPRDRRRRHCRHGTMHHAPLYMEYTEYIKLGPLSQGKPTKAWNKKEFKETIFIFFKLKHSKGPEQPCYKMNITVLGFQICFWRSKWKCNTFCFHLYIFKQKQFFKKINCPTRSFSAAPVVACSAPCTMHQCT